MFLEDISPWYTVLGIALSLPFVGLAYAIVWRFTLLSLFVVLGAFCLIKDLFCELLPGLVCRGEREPEEHIRYRESFTPILGYYQRGNLEGENLGAKPYSTQTSVLMAHISRLAYLPHPKEASDEVSRQACIQGMLDNITPLGLHFVHRQDVHQVPMPGTTVDDLCWEKNASTDTEFLLLKTHGHQHYLGKAVILAFRGTAGMLDVWTDARAAQSKPMFVRKNKHCRLHSGFWKAYKSVRDDIEPRLSALADAGYNIYFTGHSLGGALATLAAGFSDHANNAACYTQGQPRVGDLSFGWSIRTPIYRVINSTDVVPLVPGELGVSSAAQLPIQLARSLLALRYLFKWQKFVDTGVYPLIRQVRSLVVPGSFHHTGDERYLPYAKAHKDNHEWSYSKQELGVYTCVESMTRLAWLLRNLWEQKSLLHTFAAPHSSDRYFAKLKHIFLSHKPKAERLDKAA